MPVSMNSVIIRAIVSHGIMVVWNELAAADASSTSAADHGQKYDSSAHIIFTVLDNLCPHPTDTLVVDSLNRSIPVTALCHVVSLATGSSLLV